MSDEPKDWWVASELSFEDGGAQSYMLLGENMTQKECERMAEVMPAVSYNGVRKVREARLIWGRKALTGERDAERGRK